MLFWAARMKCFSCGHKQCRNQGVVRARRFINIISDRERLLVQDRARTATAPRGRRPKFLRRSRPIDRNQTRRGLPRVIRDPSGDPTQNTMVSGGCPRNRDRRRDHLQGYPGRWKHPNSPNGHGDIVPTCLISALPLTAPLRALATVPDSGCVCGTRLHLMSHFSAPSEGCNGEPRCVV